MLKNYITLTFFFSLSLLSAQVIDGSFAHESDPDKKYSLYIPSNYDEAVANPLMLGLHPLNTSRWDAKAWRDTLIVFAETNQLILACPDGGLDGRIDDDIDTSFTSVLLDSMNHWYNIDQSEKYMMGFSWGGKTTYTYGLRRTEKFKGYLVIGAAVEFNEVGDVMPNAENEAFYLLHGSNDNPSVRYEPLLGGLDAVGACTNSLLMQSVGHTIDFPNRNQLLNDAFKWLNETNCESSATKEIESNIKLFPNPARNSVTVEGINIAGRQISVSDNTGRQLVFSSDGNTIYFEGSYSGMIILSIGDQENQTVKKIFKL